MDGMMTGGGSMMTGMFVVLVLAVLVLVLVAVAAIKYLFFRNDRKD